MNLHTFRLLSEEVQLAYVYREGTYLARRWDDFHKAVLYQMPGNFFAELAYDTEQNEVEFVFAFEAGSEDGGLPDYAAFEQLPRWMPEAE